MVLSRPTVEAGQLAAVAVRHLVGGHRTAGRRVVTPLVHHPCGEIAGGASGTAVMVIFRHAYIVAHLCSK